MARLFAYDGTPIVQNSSASVPEKASAFHRVMSYGISTLDPAKLSDFLLLCGVRDNSNTQFGGIRSFLARCVTNGHASLEWQTLTADERADLEASGYTATDLMRATPATQRLHPVLPLWTQAAGGCNIAILVIDGRSYASLGNDLYVQDDKAQRKEALHGVLLFQNEGGLRRESPTLEKLSLTMEGFDTVINALAQAGYFLPPS